VALAMPFVLAGPGTAARVSTWTRWEQTLTSDRDYPNPYRDVTLRVTFAGPQGKSFAADSFWDGARTFKIRAAFPAAGEWTWSTTCSDPKNRGLHDQKGTVTVAPYAGVNPLFRHGFLQVSENRRYLQHADGTPFWWMGDTAWAAFYQATTAEWDSFLDDRAARKFTVQQIHAATGWTRKKTPADSDGNPAFAGKGETFQWNPAYWRGVERKVQAANDRGQVVYICALIEAPWRLGGANREDATEIRRFARQLAARLMGNFVVYSPIADAVWFAVADECGAALKQATRAHLVIAHPTFFLEPAVIYRDKDYTDASGVQPGAGWTFNPYKKEKKSPHFAPLAAQYAIEWPLDLYRRAPPKPVLNLEGPYDARDIQTGAEGNYRQPYPKRMPRSSGYLTILSGACGYTFGVGGVWNWGTPVPNATGGWDLKTAIRATSADEMRYMTELFTGIEWWRLEPRPELIRNQPQEWLRRAALARTAAGDLIMAYVQDNDTLTLAAGAFAAPMSGEWFNPATGRAETIPGAFPASKPHTFTRPVGWEDAVLLLRSKRAN
jgi:hypothetical protein